jgi:hypothetical protein
LLIEMENYGLNVVGQDIYVGRARVYAAQVYAVDLGPVLNALKAGTAEGLPAPLRARDRYWFWLFRPERYVTCPDEPLRPVSLGIDGYTDAPDVARALEAAE